MDDKNKLAPVDDFKVIETSKALTDGYIQFQFYALNKTGKIYFPSMFS